MAPDEDKSIDLSYLEDSKSKTPPRSGEMVAKGSVGKDFYESASGQGGTSHGAMAGIMTNMSNSTQSIVPQISEFDMKTVDVKCNYAKDRTEIFGNLTLHFDTNGIAKIPAHQVPELKKIQRARPGRFVIQAPVAPKPPAAPVAAVAPVAPVAPAAPVVPDIKPDVKPADEPKVEAAPKAPKNTAKKVPTQKSQKKGTLVNKPGADKKSQK